MDLKAVNLISLEPRLSSAFTLPIIPLCTNTECSDLREKRKGGRNLVVTTPTIHYYYTLPSSTLYIIYLYTTLPFKHTSPPLRCCALFLKIHPLF